MKNEFLSTSINVPDEKSFYEAFKRISAILVVDEDSIDDFMWYDLSDDMAEEIAMNFDDVFPDNGSDKVAHQKLDSAVLSVLDSIRDERKEQYEFIVKTIDFADTQMEREQAEGFEAVLKFTFAEDVQKQLKETAASMANIVLALQAQRLPRMPKPSGPFLA